MSRVDADSYLAYAVGPDNLSTASEFVLSYRSGLSYTIGSDKLGQAAHHLYPIACASWHPLTPQCEFRIWYHPLSMLAPTPSPPCAISLNKPNAVL